MKWTWLFQNPEVTVPPVQSTTVAPSGARTAARGPTAVMVVPSMRTTPSGIAAACDEGSTRPPTSAVTRGVDGGDGAVEHATSTATKAGTSAPVFI